MPAVEAESERAFVHLERHDGIRHVQLHRPDRLNAVSDELYADLDATLLEVTRDPSTRAILLSGAGRAFCAGADLKAHSSRSRTPAEQRAYVWAGQRACRMLRTASVPVVAAVHGHAIGAGAELALSADIIVVADDLGLAFPEVGLGTFVGGGLSQRLPLMVGPVRASELLMLGRRLSGVEAVAWGLATESVAADQVLARGWELAQTLAEQPAVSMRLAKDAIARAGTTSLDQAMTYEAEGLLACMSTDDWSDGIDGFATRASSQGDD